jgi:hypothetical protein
MRITKRQLTKLIREAQGGDTEKYDDDSALTGDQDELPDGLQKGIIDKTVEDREESNEGMISEGDEDHEMFASDDELKELGSYISDLNHFAVQVTDRMMEMSARYGELSATTTYAVKAANAAEEVSDRFDKALDEMLRHY